MNMKDPDLLKCKHLHTKIGKLQYMLPCCCEEIIYCLFLKNALLESYLLNNLWYVYITLVKTSLILHYDCGVALLLLVNVKKNI